MIRRPLSFIILLLALFATPVLAEAPKEAASCSSNADCAEDAYCSKADCGDGEGVCEVRPEACIQMFMPVCGCDGKTYGNSCQAAMKGVNVASDGECSSSSAACATEAREDREAKSQSRD